MHVSLSLLTDLLPLFPVYLNAIACTYTWTANVDWDNVTPRDPISLQAFIVEVNERFGLVKTRPNERGSLKRAQVQSDGSDSARAVVTTSVEAPAGATVASEIEKHGNGKDTDNIVRTTQEDTAAVVQRLHVDLHRFMTRQSDLQRDVASLLTSVHHDRINNDENDDTEKRVYAEEARKLLVDMDVVEEQVTDMRTELKGVDTKMQEFIVESRDVDAMMPHAHLLAAEETAGKDADDDDDLKDIDADEDFAEWLQLLDTCLR